MTIIDRRTPLIGAAAMSWGASARAQNAAALPKMVVSKDPNCGCCSGWVEHVRASGFPVETVETSDLAPIKQRLGVPPDRTAVVGDSPADLRMGRAAGARRVIAVLTGVGEGAALEPLADLVLG